MGRVPRQQILRCRVITRAGFGSPFPLWYPMRTTAFQRIEKGRLEYGGDVLNFTYKPFELTRNRIQALKDRTEEGSQKPHLESLLDYTGYLVDVILKALDSWDLADETGVLPISRETLDDLPQDFIMALHGAVTGTADPEKKETSLTIINSGSSTAENAA